MIIISLAITVVFAFFITIIFIMNTFTIFPKQAFSLNQKTHSRFFLKETQWKYSSTAFCCYPCEGTIIVFYLSKVLNFVYLYT